MGTKNILPPTTHIIFFSILFIIFPNTNLTLTTNNNMVIKLNISFFNTPSGTDKKRRKAINLQYTKKSITTSSTPFTLTTTATTMEQPHQKCSKPPIITPHKPLRNMVIITVQQITMWTHSTSTAFEPPMLPTPLITTLSLTIATTHTLIFLTHCISTIAEPHNNFQPLSPTLATNTSD